MTLAAMTTLVHSKLRRYTDLTWSDVEIYAYLNEANTEFCMRTHYLRKHGTVTITPDTGIQTTPTDNFVMYRAEWDGSLVDIRTTREMDVAYGDNWRTTTGSQVQTIIQDYEEEGKIRTYPILSASDIGTLTLAVDYAYIPADLTSGSTSFALPARFHMALVEFACYRCLEANVQSDQNPIMGDRYYDRFMSLVVMARAEVGRGKISRVNGRIMMRRFII